MGARAVYLLVRQVLGAAVSQVEQARVDQTAVVPGSWPIRPPGFPTYIALLFVVGYHAWL